MEGTLRASTFFPKLTTQQMTSSTSATEFDASILSQLVGPGMSQEEHEELEMAKSMISTYISRNRPSAKSRRSSPKRGFRQLQLENLLPEFIEQINLSFINTSPPLQTKAPSGISKVAKVVAGQSKAPLKDLPLVAPVMKVMEKAAELAETGRSAGTGGGGQGGGGGGGDGKTPATMSYSQLNEIMRKVYNEIKIRFRRERERRGIW